MIDAFSAARRMTRPAWPIARPIAWIALLTALPTFATPAAGETAAPTAVEPTVVSDVRRYCTSIAAAATDSRFAWQTTRLNELEIRVKARIKDLDAKEIELRAWIEKREALERKAAERLVGIYAKMRPETAAVQISSLDDDMAAAVLGQLNPRQASAIFNEINPERAAKLAGLIAANPAANPEGKRL